MKLDRSIKIAFMSIGISCSLANVAPSSAIAAYFGKNKVQYTYFAWKYLTTKHFDIYYNQDGRGIADFAAEVAEAAYSDIARNFRYPESDQDPITMVTYQSHNDFQQTNVTSEQLTEGVGGFTEYLKTRVVVPFEGNYEKFRHVIHHELTHAMMLNLLYGQGFGAVVSGLSQSRLPLWFTEGLAEYESRGGLDRETEMFLRDAVFNDQLPDINRLDQYGYLGVYKSGQSILYYIAYRYGAEKIGEILHQVKSLRDFDRALKASIGVRTNELSKRWNRFIKERYWPQVVAMESPAAKAFQLTDHEKEYSYINNSPALSPDGEWLAFLSDRSSYFDVYLMNVVENKVVRRLVRGQRSGQFEELHWLRPGITWSPDGKRIAFCAKAGKGDVMYLIDVETGNIARRYQFQSDGLFSPAWAPDGSRIALVRVLNGSSDVAIVDVESGRLSLLTDDVFDDADPAWSPGGDKILFVSNRGEWDRSTPSPAPIDVAKYPFDEFDVFEADLATGEIARITSDPFVERSPHWSPLDNTLLYVSDRTGAYNIYLHNLTTGEATPITNVVTGCFQPTLSPSTNALAFASYFNNGYDIFLYNDPFKSVEPAKPPQLAAAEKIPKSDLAAPNFNVEPGDYSQFVFDRLLSRSEAAPKEGTDTTVAAQRMKDEDGKYPSRDYRMSLSPDLVYVDASYSPYFRTQGSGLILFSDVLGNNQLYLALELNGSTENSNFFFMYEYLARRLDYGGGFYHYAYPFYSNRTIWLDRNWGLFGLTSYPLNRYDRADFSLEYLVIERSVLASDYRTDPPGARRATILPSAGYVHDTSVWTTSTSPTTGGRWRVDLSWSPNIMSDPQQGLSFTSLSFDWRRYFPVKNDYSFGLRLAGAASEGSNPQRYYLGGVQNWFNPWYDNPEGSVLIDRIEDIYFASFVTPLRGVGYYNQIGTRYLLGNLEFRFPFIRHLLFGWPLPIYFRDVRGALFADYGAAWNPDAIGKRILPKDFALGIGFGLRVDLGIFPLEWDVAWSKDSVFDMIPRHYLSINLGY